MRKCCLMRQIKFFFMYLQCAFNVFNFENLLNDKKDEEIEQFVDLTIRV
jgi:hypothetical protein